MIKFLFALLNYFKAPKTELQSEPRISDSPMTIERGVLGYRNYRSDKKEFFKQDFEDPKMLQKFLNEMCTGEGDITVMGRDFLLDKFINSDLAQHIADIGGVIEDDFLTAEQIKEFVEQHKPHEVAMFIAEAGAKHK